MRSVHLPLLSLILALTACSAPVRPSIEDPNSGQTQVKALREAAPGARLELATNETFFMPLQEVHNDPPEYPEALLAQRLPPRILCLSLAIDEDGKVTDFFPVLAGPECETASITEEAFLLAASEAVKHWQFIPAFRCVYPNAESVTEGCGLNDSHEEPQAISLVFRFRFEQVDGQGRVRLD